MAQNDAAVAAALGSALARREETLRSQLYRAMKHRQELLRRIEFLKQSVGKLESKRVPVVALKEYKTLRVDVLQAYKTLAKAELEIISLRKQREAACKELMEHNRTLG
jgi:hypothetical protein